MEKPTQTDHYILVIEDDPTIRDLLTEQLTMGGYSVMPFADGKAAFAFLRHHATPCLILLDLRLPVMDGWTFRALQRADPALQHIPVAVISAYSRESDTARNRALDPVAYIEKPFEFADLLDLVARHCGPQA